MATKHQLGYPADSKDPKSPYYEGDDSQPSNDPLLEGMRQVRRQLNYRSKQVDELREANRRAIERNRHRSVNVKGSRGDPDYEVALEGLGFAEAKARQLTELSDNADTSEAEIWGYVGGLTAEADTLESTGYLAPPKNQSGRISLASLAANVYELDIGEDFVRSDAKRHNVKVAEDGTVSRTAAERLVRQAHRGRKDRYGALERLKQHLERPPMVSAVPISTLFDNMEHSDGSEGKATLDHSALQGEQTAPLGDAAVFDTEPQGDAESVFDSDVAVEPVATAYDGKVGKGGCSEQKYKAGTMMPSYCSKPAKWNVDKGEGTFPICTTHKKVYERQNENRMWGDPVILTPIEAEPPVEQPAKSPKDNDYVEAVAIETVDSDKDSILDVVDVDFEAGGEPSDQPVIDLSPEQGQEPVKVEIDTDFAPTIDDVEVAVAETDSIIYDTPKPKKAKSKKRKKKRETSRVAAIKSAAAKASRPRTSKRHPFLSRSEARRK